MDMDQVSHLRLVSVDRQVAVSSVMTQIPGCPIMEDFDIDNLSWRFRVDNMIVLGYFQNDTMCFRRYRTYGMVWY